MVSYSHWYTQKHPEVNQWLMNENCGKCPFMKRGLCIAEWKLNILSGQKRSGIYIAIYYHKHLNSAPCFLKGILHQHQQHPENFPCDELWCPKCGSGGIKESVWTAANTPSGYVEYFEELRCNECGYEWRDRNG